MARLRSVAHLGTTRSGHRCIARWAQSTVPRPARPTCSRAPSARACDPASGATAGRARARCRHRNRGPTRAPPGGPLRRALAAPRRRLPARRSPCAAGTGVLATLGDEPLELTLLEAELWRGDVFADPEQRVTRDAVGIEPDAVARGAGAELPVDRRLAPGLRMALQVCSKNRFASQVRSSCCLSRRPAASDQTVSAESRRRPR